MTERGTSEQWVTTDIKTAFLRSAKEQDILRTARLLKLGTAQRMVQRSA